MDAHRDENTAQIRENLLDASCPDVLIERFLALRAAGRTPEQFALLQGHRKALLASMHEIHHAVDCLDYLLFRIQKELRPDAKP